MLGSLVTAVAISFGSLTAPSAHSITTPQWGCVRMAESTNGRYSSNLYQFQGTAFKDRTGLRGWPGSYSRAIQDKAALAEYRWAAKYEGSGWVPWIADWYRCHLH